VGTLEHHEGPTGVVALDDRWFPVVIATWWGEIVSEHVEAHYAWYDRELARAASEGSKLVAVNDILELQRVAGAIRRRFAEETDAREDELRENVVGIFVVARRALWLGMAAAVVSMVGGGLRISSFGDMPSALERALVKLDHASVPRPAGLDPATYVRPSQTEE
jgi:hypothetical protein